MARTDADRLARVRARLAKLQCLLAAPDPVAQAFPLGRVGGGGNGPNVRRLNARREANLDRVIDAAVEVQQLQREEARLARCIREATPEHQTAQAAKARDVAAAAAQLEAIIRALPPGSSIESQYGTGTIVRHNQKSATVKFALFQEAIAYAALWPSQAQLQAALKEMPR